MSLQNIRNGIITTLAASGPWIAAELSTCDFGVMEQVSACAIVLMPGTATTVEPEAMNAPGRYYFRRWDISGRLYIKDTGDPRKLLSLCWQGHDDLFNTLSKDDSAAGQAQEMHLKSLSFDPDTYVNAAGADWAIVKFGVEALEF